MRRSNMFSLVRKLGLAALAGLALLVGTAHQAAADGCESDNAASGSAGKNFHVEIINGKPVTVIDDVVQVCGKVPRPSVVYVLLAKNINYEWETLKQDFLPLILASIRRPPF